MFYNTLFINYYIVIHALLCQLLNLLQRVRYSIYSALFAQKVCERTELPVLEDCLLVLGGLWHTWLQLF